MCAVNNFIEKNNVSLKTIVLFLGVLSIIIGGLYGTAFFVAKNNLKYEDTKNNFILIRENKNQIDTINLNVAKLETNQQHLMQGQSEIKLLLRR